MSGGWYDACPDCGGQKCRVALRCVACRPAYVRSRAALEARFWPKVDRSAGPDACWLWMAAKSPAGYGKVSAGGGGHLSAHRVAYELLVGPIPEGLTLDHLCRVPTCVNPAHLEPVTMRENILRGFSPMAQQARQTHCIQGHPFDAVNTYISPQGMRKCRECARARDRRRGWRRPGWIRPPRPYRRRVKALAA